MADAIVRLKVESQEYDAKVKRAAEGLKHFQEECRRAGGTLEYVEKEDLAFVKALGSMETKATSSRQQMREFTEAIIDLQMQYKSLTDAEKSAPYGQALQESINQLKQRGGELKDMMGDLNEELTHIASDTAFTDGVNLMTRTIGACSSAMVAWGGKSQTMEEMIKSLAKIQTTVGAVEALTKAFQKQNLVLLKNPYVAAAAGAAALAIAVGKVISKLTEESQVQKDLNEVETKGRENAAKQVLCIEQLNTILHDNTRSNEERRTALEAIQALVPDYHGALTEEGALINDNTGAIDDYIDGLKRAAIAQAAFDKMVELQKQKMEKQVALGKAQETLRHEQDLAAKVQAVAGYQTGGAMDMSGVANGVTRNVDVNATQRRVDNIQRECDAIDEEIQALSDLTKAADIAGNAVTKVSTGGKGGNGGKTTTTEAPVEGSIDAQQAKVAALQKAWEAAATDDARAIIKQQLDDANAVLDAMMGKTKEVGLELSEAFSEPAEGTLPYLRQQLQEAMECLNECVIGSEAWAEALADVKKAQEKVNDAQNLINGTSQSTESTAKGTVDAWQNAAIALQAAASVMNAIDDPSAKIAGTLAQAVASIMLGFAQATASPANTVAGVFGWIAASLSGLATAISMVSTIKSVTAGSYAEGGIIPGTSFSGDRLTANVNSGELILNRAQQANIAGQLQSKGIDSMNIRFEIDGTKLIGVQNNTIKAKGGRRSNLIYQH